MHQSHPSDPTRPQPVPATASEASHPCCTIWTSCEHEARCCRSAAVGVHCVLRRKGIAGGDMRAWQHVLNVPLLPCAFHSTVKPLRWRRCRHLPPAQPLPAHYRRLLVCPQTADGPRRHHASWESLEESRGMDGSGLSGGGEDSQGRRANTSIGWVLGG